MTRAINADGYSSSTLINPENLLSASDKFIRTTVQASEGENTNRQTSSCEMLANEASIVPKGVNGNTGLLINPTLFDFSNTNNNNAQSHQQSIYRNILEGKYDSSSMPPGNIAAGPLENEQPLLFPGIIEPSPLPPRHGNNDDSKWTHQALVEAARVISSKTEGETNVLPTASFSAQNVGSAPSSSAQIAQRENNLVKRNHDFAFKTIVTPGSLSPLLHQCDPILPFDFVDSSSINGSNIWTRPTKRMKRTEEESIQVPLKGATREMHSMGEYQTVPSVSGIHMAMDCDGDYLSEYQCLVRKQIEIFEASAEDVKLREKGRNCAVFMGQVGIRCKYCASIPGKARPRGASYFTSSLNGLYQAAQKMTTDHFFKHCHLIPESVKDSLLTLKKDRKRAWDGKRYWAESARSVGIRETENRGLRLVRTPNQEAVPCRFIQYKTK